MLWHQSEYFPKIAFSRGCTKEHKFVISVRRAQICYWKVFQKQKQFSRLPHCSLKQIYYIIYITETYKLYKQNISIT